MPRAYLIALVQQVGPLLVFIDVDVYSEPSPTLAGAYLPLHLAQADGRDFEEAKSKVLEEMLNHPIHRALFTEFYLGESAQSPETWRAKHDRTDKRKKMLAVLAKMLAALAELDRQF